MKLTAKVQKELAARRTQLMKAIGKNAVAIIPGASEVTRSRDTHYRFRQDSDFRYLTGFPEPDSIAVLAPGRADGAYLLFVRKRDAEREIWDGRRAGPEGAVADYGADQAFTIDEFDRMLPSLLAGREVVHYSLGEHPELDGRITRVVRDLRELSRRGAAAPYTFTALDISLHEMRLFKRPLEAEIMRRACRYTAQAHCLAMQTTKPGMFEWQIGAVLHAEFERHDMPPGYGSIIGGGDNACILHYVENNMVLKDGDLLLIDAGGELEGYSADITRTFPVNGKFSGPQKAVYDVVLAANEQAITALKAGASSGKPHETALKVLTQGMVDLGLLQGTVDGLIESGAYRQFYMHGTGHWLGMDVHDVGRYRFGGKPRKFEPGMVMTVEPGLYIAPGTPNVPEAFLGIGIRVEDDVLVTEKGPEVLTAGVPKHTADIEALMAG